MAQFFIQIDKDFYFSGQTVNGHVWVNVPGLIQGATGISLRFTGYECVKWVDVQELHRPRPHNDPNRPQPVDPIALIPPDKIFHSDAPIVISDPESQDNRDFDHRPPYIRNSNDRYFKCSYYQTRNMFTKNRSLIYQCNGFASGQYSFPFNFKTFEGWPASFSHITPRKKGVIIYHMTVAIQGMTKNAQIKFSRQIILRQTRMVKAQKKTSQGEITSCCCLSKGISSADIHFEKDGYMPGQLVQMVVQIDNSNCQVKINSVNISINKTVTMRSGGASTSDGGSIYRKQINGIPAKSSKIGNDAIRQSFQLPPSAELKPSCSGKLLSCSYSLGVGMQHDISCQCCSDHIGGSIPIIIFPYMPPYTIPQQFTANWAPQMMPTTNMALQNNFNNFNLANLQAQQQYPPQNQYPTMNPPMNQGMGGGGMGMNQGPPPQNYGQTPQYNMGGFNNSQYQNSGMNQGMGNNGMANNPYGQGY